MKQEIDPAAATEDRAEKPQAKQKPEVDLYQPYQTPRSFYECLRVFIKFVCFFTMHIHLRGRYNIPRKGPYIVAPNHLSWMDIPLIPTYIPDRVVYMAKYESFVSKVGWLVRFLGAFPVKRGTSDRRSLRTAEEQLKAGHVVIIFPEGTRSKTHTMTKANDGLGLIALRSGMPILPVAISGSENALKKFGAHVTIAYGEPFVLKPKQGTRITREDIQQATDEVMKRVAAMLPESYRGLYGSEPQAEEQQTQS